MAGEIIQHGDLAPDDDGFAESGQNFVVVDGDTRYELPDDYTFRAEGSSLVVLDGAGQVAMILADGAWGAATARGAKFRLVEDDEDNS